MTVPDDRRCTAHTKASGGQNRCKRAAIPGGTVCTKHGGGAPQVRNAANRRLQREQLDGAIGGLLAELEDEARKSPPVAVLLDAVHRCSAMAQVLGAYVGGLGPDDLFGPDHLGDARPHVAVTMYETWLDRAARAAKLACDAGVDEQIVRAVVDYRFGGVELDVLT